MEPSSFPPHKLIDGSTLTDWEVIGAGGFGQVHKVRHKRWCYHVAVKLLRNDDGDDKALLREVKMMCEGSSPYVIQVIGVFQGRHPSSSLVQLGLVMELMERGSLASMQATLSYQSPPWPLVFRLAYQVALGTNFLHNLDPPILHLDLKPSNVLLDPCLNAKLTDFGLSRHTDTVSKEEKGGTVSYMPPEAFKRQYKPTQASDVYSYGILLWSIITGKIPYESVPATDLVRLLVPKGDRPPLEEITNLQGHEELMGLVNLMKRCWKKEPEQRPSSRECAAEAEGMFEPRKRAVVDAVHQVLKEMDASEQDLRCGHSGLKALLNGIRVPTHPPVQEEARGLAGQKGAISRQKESSSTGRSETDSGLNDLKPSSAKPIPPSSSSAGGTTRELSPRPAEPHARSTSADAPLPSNSHKTPYKQAAPGFKQQPSTPVSHQINLFNCNLSGVQFGDNGIMNIRGSRRERHPSAPSSIPPTQRDGTGKRPG